VQIPSRTFNVLTIKASLPFHKLSWFDCERESRLTVQPGEKVHPECGGRSLGRVREARASVAGVGQGAESLGPGCWHPGSVLRVHQARR